MDIRKNESKHYNKPQINKINLAMGEAVLTACKTSLSDTTGNANRGCNIGACKKIQGS